MKSMLFRYYLPLEIGATLHLIKLESPLHKVVLCQVWLLKFTLLFWRKKSFECSRLFRYSLPLEIDVALHLN